MYRPFFWGKVYYLFSGIHFASIGGAVLIGAILRTEPKKWPALADAFQWVHDDAWWLILAMGIAAAVSKTACWWLGPPWVWRSIQKILDKFREKAFDIQDLDPVHAHRVTLYRYTWLWWVWPWRSRFWPWGQAGRLRFPWSGWLIPVVRSGHTHQRTVAVFLAPDDAQHAEGVAGRAWATEYVFPVRGLPRLTAASPDDSFFRVASYSPRTASGTS